MNTLLDFLQGMKHSPIRNYAGIPGVTSWLIGTPGPTGLVRLFESSRSHPEPIIPHSHRFDFRCRVLAGEVANVIWERDIFENSDEYQETSLIYTGEPGKYRKVPGGVSRWVQVSKDYIEGDEYSMTSDQVHSIFFSRGAAVLFFEGPTVTDTSIILEPYVDGERVPTFTVPEWAFKKGGGVIGTVHFGDCRESLRAMAAAGVKVQTCVTSPPYYGLRDYGVDGQIGLEETPEQFIAELVDVFRCVWDVLADDGTLWINIGDSYARTGGTDRKVSATATVGSTRNTMKQMGDRTTKASDIGLKEKDLIGIPWMLARALRDPYYTGRITKEIDRMWLAAMIDGEGCMFIHKRKAGSDSGAKFTKADGSEVSYARKQDTFSPGLEVANTHLGIVERCQQITGLGTITRQDKDRRLPLYRWHLRADEARQIVREVYPYLIGKRQQARILCGCPTNGEQADAAHRALMLLHNGGMTDVDFKDPASMLEPGFYLRQDIIWSKPNPMPESVTDRCTKAHEYIFLLSKGPRYYFDSEAMKEPVQSNKGNGRSFRGGGSYTGGNSFNNHQTKERETSGNLPNESGLRNRRSVWTVATKPYAGAHFATFPPALIEPCILAGSRPGDIVLDPFMGSGTTAEVSILNGREFIGCELNQEYKPLQDERIAAARAEVEFNRLEQERASAQMSLFSEVAA